MLWCWPSSHIEKVLSGLVFFFFFFGPCLLALKSTLQARAALVKFKARQEPCQLLRGVEAHDFLENSRLP